MHGLAQMIATAIADLRFAVQLLMPSFFVALFTIARLVFLWLESVPANRLTIKPSHFTPRLHPSCPPTALGYGFLGKTILMWLIYAKDVALCHFYLFSSLDVLSFWQLFNLVVVSRLKTSL